MSSQPVYRRIPQPKIDPSRPSQRHNYAITDFFSNYEEISKIPGPKQDIVTTVGEQEEEPERKTCVKMILDYFMITNPSHWIFLILMAFLTTIIAIGVEFVVKFITEVKIEYCVHSDLPYIYKFGIWVGLAFTLTLIAASVGEYISKDAEGSGIPEMKSILAGVNIYRYLSFQTLIGKIIGLTAGLSAGLSIGKEGPFVHLAGGVTNKLCKLSYFKDIQNNHSFKKQMLAAAVACGVTATFGAPIGGVLFSIEVTSTYYFVSNLWKAFFCACIAVVMLKGFSTYGLYDLVVNSEPMTIGHGYEYFNYGLLGLLCGILGSIFIQVLTKLIWLRTKIKAPFIADRWKLCSLIGLLTGICTFCITFLKTPEKQLLNQFFSTKPLESHTSTAWDQPAVGFNLFIFVVIKFILEVIAISCPIPAGVFTPTFVLGAAFGRLYGYCLRQILGPGINEAAYSVIGAACTTSSVTRTISVAMIVFELNGELSYMIPVLFAVLISYAISNSLAMSIFDILLDMKDLPYLPALRSVEHYRLKANNIMSKNFLYLTKNSQLSDIIALLQHLGPKAKSIPVVESEEDKLLLYSVQAQSLRKYLFSYYNTISHTLDKETRDRLNRYFYNLYAISSIKMKEFSKNRKEQEEEALAFLNPGQHPDKSGHLDEELLAKKPSFLARQESRLKVREFNQRDIKFADSDMSSSDSSFQDDFWMIQINYDHPFLEIDRAPFTVFEETSLSKIHFLFTMLNLSQLFVIRKGVLVGIITKNDFLKKKKFVLEQKKERPLSEIPDNPIISVQMNPLNTSKQDNSFFGDKEIREESVEDSPRKTPDRKSSPNPHRR